MASTRSSTAPLAALLALCGVGCGTDEIVDTVFVDPTEVAVDPLDFMGEVACTPQEGGARAYVMTLAAWDDAEDPFPFVVGSGRPASCALVSGFRDLIVIGQRYSAEIDIYDVAPELLEPFGGSSSGARQMRSVETGEVVQPRWQTQCGGGASTAVVALEDTRVFVRPCDPASNDATTAQLNISGESILGPEPCEVAPTFDVTFADSNLLSIAGQACDAEPVLVDIAPNETVFMRASITQDGEELGASCEATAAPGTTATPACDAFTTFGTVRLDLTTLVDEDEALYCPAEGSFNVVDAGEPLNLIPLACNVAAYLGPFTSGIRTFDVSTFDAADDAVASLNCAANVEPGGVTDAVCLPATP